MCLRSAIDIDGSAAGSFTGQKPNHVGIFENRKVKMEYHCTENNCKYDGNKPYRLSIPTEVCEQNNMATPFCPHCGTRLEEKAEASA